MHFPYAADDRICRTGSRAKRTSLTFIRINLIVKKILTDACRTFFIHDMRNIFLSEIPQRGEHGIGGRLSQRAERTGFQVIAQLFQPVQIFHLRLPFCNLFQNLQHTPCSDPAGRTFSAGFVYCKLQEKLGNIHHTGVLIHNDQAAGTHHRTYGDQIIVVYGHIQMFRRNTSAGRASGLGRLELLPAGNASADLFHDLPQCSSHGDLHQTGVVDLSAQSEYFGSLGLLRSHRSEPLRPVYNNLGNIGKCFYVI